MSCHTEIRSRSSEENLKNVTLEDCSMIYAKDENDIELYFLVGGDGDEISYLMDLFEGNHATTAFPCKTTLNELASALDLIPATIKFFKYDDFKLIIEC